MALKYRALSTWLPVFVASWLPVLFGSRVVAATLFVLPFWGVAVVSFDIMVRYIQPDPDWVQIAFMLVGVAVLGGVAGALSLFFLSGVVALLLGLVAGCIAIYCLLGCAAVYVWTDAKHAQFLHENSGNWMALVTFVMGLCGASVALLVFKHPGLRPYTTIAIGAFSVCYAASKIFGVPFDVASTMLTDESGKSVQWVWTFALSMVSILLFLVGTALELGRTRHLREQQQAKRKETTPLLQSSP